MSITIDAAYFQEKVRVCLRLARALPWNSPVRYQLLLMAEDFQVCEIELECRFIGLRRGSDLRGAARTGQADPYRPDRSNPVSEGQESESERSESRS